MSFLKNKYFLPVCLAGILTGYGAAEWVMPKYFSPPTQTTISSQEFFQSLGNANPQYYRATLSGNFLAGSFAQNRKDWEQASAFMGRVLDRDPENMDIKKHAMVLAMASGEVNRAIDLAQDIIKDDNSNLLAVLFASLKDFRAENYLGAKETLDKIKDDSMASFIIPILQLWADTAQGKIDISGLDENAFYGYHVLLAGLYLNKESAVIPYVKKAFDEDVVDIRDIEKMADLYAKVGEIEDARKLYTYLKTQGFVSDDINQKLILLRDNKSLEDVLKTKKITSPKDGAALVFLDMAEIVLRERSEDSATIFAQMALHLDPRLGEAHMIIANVLSRNERFEEAIEAFEKVEKQSEFHRIAQRKIADLYAEKGKSNDAIKILQNLYQDHQDIEALIQIGDIYRYDEDYKSAVEIYNQVIEKWDEVPEAYWYVLYSRGMAHERLKNFKASEVDLLAALKFRPEHPYLLNYLGYSWADQGVNLERAMDMIKQAVMMKPNDGYIADSLGWVYFKMFDFEKAIPHLERAVELLPYDATINDHLGDAYWRVGRKLEARFQWQRAKNYSEETDAALKEQITEKLSQGLPDISVDDLKKITDTVYEEKLKLQADTAL